MDQTVSSIPKVKKSNSNFTKGPQKFCSLLMVKYWLEHEELDSNPSLSISKCHHAHEAKPQLWNHTQAVQTTPEGSHILTFIGTPCPWGLSHCSSLSTEILYEDGIDTSLCTGATVRNPKGPETENRDDALKISSVPYIKFISIREHEPNQEGRQGVENAGCTRKFSA